jgi:putative ABC transport system permease protein
LGALRRDVLLQFLLEAVALALVGGFTGIVLAAGGLALLRDLSSIPATLEPWAVALGVGFSALVGVSAGFLPALKAASLDVIESLRYE